jgi:hypothetical protein
MIQCSHGGGHGDVYPLVKSQPTFRTNTSPSSTGLESMPSKESVLPGLLFTPYDGEDLFLRHIG